MSIAEGYKITWSDIQDIYTNLNTARTKFSMATVAVPSNPGKPYPSQINDLATLVDAMNSNEFLTSVANTGVSAPAVGSLIEPTEFNRISTTIDNIYRTCPHHGAYYAAHYATHRSSYYSAHYATHRSSYYSSDYTSNYGSHRSAYYSSNYGSHRGAYYSSNYGSRRSAYYSSNYGSRRSAYYSSHRDYDQGCDYK